MTEQHEASYLDEIESDPRGRVELALAHFSLRLEELLVAAKDARSDISIGDLAELMEVSTSRVESLIDGDDPIPAEAFIRYVRALGYSAVINLVPAETEAPELSSHITEWGAELVDTYQQAASDGHGMQTVHWRRERTVTTGLLEPLGSATYIATRDSRSGRTFHDDGASQPIFEFSANVEYSVDHGDISPAVLSPVDDVLTS